MLSMNVGQVELVKLFERPPSKKLGSGLEEAVDELSVDVEDAVVSLEVFEVELFSVVESAVDTGILRVVVTEAVTVLFLNSCSSGCRAVHFPSSQSRTFVSKMSASTRSGVAIGSGVAVGCGPPSRLGSWRSATSVGCGSSSSGDAMAMEAKKTMKASALAQCVDTVHDDGDDEEERVVDDKLQQGAKRVNEAMIISRRQRACGTCTTLFGR